MAGERRSGSSRGGHLHDAVAALEELIGVVDVEHVLDEVFRRFCVGK